MSIDIYGQICYGVQFGCEEFPWDKEEFNHDILNWWINSALKYSTPDKISSLDIGRHKSAFVDANPLPVKAVNYTGSGCELLILAIPSTVWECATGYPTRFNLEELTYTPQEEYNLIRFIEEYITENCPSPQWYLSCYFAP